MQGTQAQEKKEMLAWFGIDDYNALPVMFRQGSSVFRVHIFCSSTEIPSTAFLNISYPKTKKKTLNDMNISCMIEKHLGAEKYLLIMPVA
jgi:tRNA(His) 5'-end guanylyltransferase